MAYAYDASLIERIIPRIKQWEATTGRRIQPAMLEALIKGQLGAEGDRASRERAYDIQEQQIANQQAEQKKADRAAKVSGVVGGIGTAANIGLTYKAVTRPSPIKEYLDAVKATNKAPTSPNVGAQEASAAPVVGDQTYYGTPAYKTPSETYGADLSSAEYAPADVGAYYQGAAPASAEKAYSPTGSSVGNAAVGAAAGIATQYAVTKTGEGKYSNARVADWSRAFGMTNLSDEEYAEKGSATVGGVAGGGPWGAAIAATVYDVANIFKTGKVSNELLGIPFADKIFNTDIGSIFGW